MTSGAIAEPHAEPRHYAAVAIGASAGGLTDISAVLSGLPAAFTCSVFVVQHMAANFESHLAELLGRHTGLRVQEAREDMRIHPGTAYIAQPDEHLVIRDGRVHLAHSAAVRFSRPSIDTLFESVAAAYGEHAIAVVLSGSGRDGADGMRAVKQAGGYTIVEDPDEARFSAMPRAAIATHCVDRVVRLAEIPAVLLELGELRLGRHA